jgi:hypothetical protein
MKMKRIITYIFTLALLSITACSNDSGGGTITDPFGGGTIGTGGNGNVVITISSRQEQDGSTVFSATPSVAVKLSKLTVSVPAEQYTESFQFDGTTVANANVSEDFLQYPANAGVASGQQWTFQFEGTLASNNQTFNVTSNYTIP